MVDLDIILAGLSDAFTLWNLCFVISGVVLGQLVVPIPGIGPVMAIAIAIPFTSVSNLFWRSHFLLACVKGARSAEQFQQFDQHSRDTRHSLQRRSTGTRLHAGSHSKQRNLRCFLLRYGGHF